MQLHFAEYKYIVFEWIGEEEKLINKRVFIPFYRKGDSIIFIPYTIADPDSYKLIEHILLGEYPTEMLVRNRLKKVKEMWGNLTQDLKKQFITQSEKIHKTDFVTKSVINYLIFFILESSESLEDSDLKILESQDPDVKKLLILLFQEEMKSDSSGYEIKQINSNPDFNKKYVIIGSNINYNLNRKVKNYDRIEKALHLYQYPAAIDIDFIYLILGLSKFSSLTGNRFIDEQLYLNMGFEELYRISLTNSYAKNIINSKSFVEEYFDKHKLSRDIVLDKRENLSYYDFWVQINQDWLYRIMPYVSDEANVSDFITNNTWLINYEYFTVFLLSRYPNMGINLINDQSMLLMMISNYLPLIVKYILDHIPDKNVINASSAYYSAIYYTDLNVVKLLFENGILLQGSDINGVIRYAETGRRPTMPTMKPNPEIVQYLRTVFYVQ